MKWLKVPLDDEVYQILSWMAEATGSSPEELIMRIVTGSTRGYVKMLAEGREEEIKQLILSPATRKAVEEALREKIPEQSKLWIP